MAHDVGRNWAQECPSSRFPNPSSAFTSTIAPPSRRFMLSYPIPSGQLSGMLIHHVQHPEHGVWIQELEVWVKIGSLRCFFSFLDVPPGSLFELYRKLSAILQNRDVCIRRRLVGRSHGTCCCSSPFQRISNLASHEQKPSYKRYKAYDFVNS